jgi:hypothetical protein
LSDWPLEGNSLVINYLLFHHSKSFSRNCLEVSSQQPLPAAPQRCYFTPYMLKPLLPFRMGNIPQIKNPGLGRALLPIHHPSMSHLFSTTKFKTSALGNTLPVATARAALQVGSYIVKHAANWNLCRSIAPAALDVHLVIGGGYQGACGAYPPNISGKKVIGFLDDGPGIKNTAVCCGRHGHFNPLRCCSSTGQTHYLQ